MWRVVARCVAPTVEHAVEHATRDRRPRLRHRQEVPELEQRCSVLVPRPRAQSALDLRRLVLEHHGLARRLGANPVVDQLTERAGARDGLLCAHVLQVHIARRERARRPGEALGRQDGLHRGAVRRQLAQVLAGLLQQGVELGAHRQLAPADLGAIVAGLRARSEQHRHGLLLARVHLVRGHC
eukprot:2287256-Prymnesium_polylepis.1